MKQLLTLSILVLLFSCKSNRFITESNYEQTRSHEQVAVLPVQVKTTGNLPKDLTPSQLEEIEKSEALFFQDIILSSILRRQRSNRPFWVEFMSNHEVNAVLEKNGVTYDEINNYKPNELAKILGVDAVVMSKVNKERYMSDTASSIIYGVDQVLDVITDTGIGIPNIVNRTYDVNMNISVVDGKQATVIYDRFVDVNIDFRNSSEDAIEQLSRKISKRFPYREYKY